jgi:membrane protein YdbS with pleckstrin-like domain
MQLTTAQQTRQCPFCAETILAAAVKCRFCGEFLNTDKAKALMRNTGQEEQRESEQAPSTSSGQEGDVLFSGQPSLWIMAGTIIKGAIALAVAVTLVVWHIERLSALNLTTQQTAVFGKYRLLAGIALGLVTLLVLIFKTMQVKATYYEISADRIEFGTGLFDRKVDNLDMFRIVDIKLRRSFLDCIVGVGSVLLTTTDKSHPEFMFKKVRYARELYDAIKKASLSADRKTNVIHME